MAFDDLYRRKFSRRRIFKDPATINGRPAWQVIEERRAAHKKEQDIK